MITLSISRGNWWRVFNRHATEIVCIRGKLASVHLPCVIALVSDSSPNKPARIMHVVVHSVSLCGEMAIAKIKPATQSEAEEATKQDLREIFPFLTD